MDFRTTLTILVVASLGTGCASAPPAPREPAREAVIEASPANPQGEALVRVAAGLIGTPYRFGGEDPHAGFDCSGLVVYSFDKLGVEVPRTAADQRAAATPVAPEDLSPGDLVFFKSRRRVDHVGIYAGDGKFIHAPRSGAVVSYAYLEDPYYRAHFAGAGRLALK